MRVAVEGCCHGELDKIYETLAYLEKKDNVKVDILLICGDFQAVRNRSDLKAMAVPPKYQKMNTFYKYYAGEKKAPVLTVFIGGNHEASNYLQELPYGGWVAHNIYYMGYANVLNFGGIRIGGMSGIYKGRDYAKGHHERPPYNDETIRSAYHVRNFDVFRLKQIKRPIDIFLSHDWPRGIYDYGNKEALLRKKKFFRAEVEQGILGSPAAEEVLFELKPEYWFSAHLHVKFAAMVEHKLPGDQTKSTRFLSLDKCLPKRNFLQVLDIPHDTNKELELALDPEWLCILKTTNHLLNLSRSSQYLPGIGSAERHDFCVSEADMAVLDEDFQGIYKVPNNFKRTADIFQERTSKKDKAPNPEMLINPQTTLLCEMLGLTDPFAVFSGKQKHDTQAMDMSSSSADSALLSPDDSDDVPSDDEPPSFIETTLEMTLDTSQDVSALNTTNNPDEISLDDLDDDEDEEGSDKGVDEEPAMSPSANIRIQDPLGLEDPILNEGNLNQPALPQEISSSPSTPTTCSKPMRRALHLNEPINSENLSSPIIGSSSPSGSGFPQSPLAGMDKCHPPLGGSTPIASAGKSPPYRVSTLAMPTTTKRPSDDSDAGMSSSSSPSNKTRDSDLDASQEDNIDQSASGEPEAQEPAGPKKPKQFKRRNQALYVSADDDSST